MQLLKDKNIVVMGVANKWSIAWGIAKACIEQGGNVIFTYYGDKSKQNIIKLLSSIGVDEAPMYECNVADESEIAGTMKVIGEKYETINSLVHSVAFAKKEELMGQYYDTSQEGYLLAQNISSFSLVASVRYIKPYMIDNSSVVTMTYLGAEKALPNYNVMGVAKAALEASVRYLSVDLGMDQIRINSISAGPIKTASAKGVRDFNKLLAVTEERAPLKRVVKSEEIANTAVFLCSDMSTGITGENIHVDCGYHVL